MALIIGISYALEPIWAWSHKRYNYQRYAYLEWITNGSLQLHRQAHEDPGESQWTDCDRNIPITKPDVHLANLDISDPRHPFLAKHYDRDMSLSEVAQLAV